MVQEERPGLALHGSALGVRLRALKWLLSKELGERQQLLAVG